MPKTTSLLFYKKPLNPTTEIFPLRFKELLPLKLRNEVTYKAAAGQDAPEKCLQEMTGMFECFKKNEFDQVVCAKEILQFKMCSERSREQEAKLDAQNKLGTLIPGSERLTARQANVLLKRYPQYNDPSKPDRWPR
ncbi:hypothetical protein RvY_08592 [Ramazzottius varieornatus]|uniref:CHCH domain-containing protein n=1 Tax=Ramazzottius varieornatus TaxID=947166 RepID=A0A1D1V6C2_RAMVA|nr:hypothetical protein RvY_08592 [Ramazzottius varieornatus]